MDLTGYFISGFVQERTDESIGIAWFLCGVLVAFTGGVWMISCFLPLASLTPHSGVACSRSIVVAGPSPLGSALRHHQDVGLYLGWMGLNIFYQS